MAGDFSKKTQTSNASLADLTGARFAYIDGSSTAPVNITTQGCRLIRIILNTNGATLNVKSGSRPIANIALDAPEGTFDYGIYCENGLTYQAGGAGDWTLVFAR